MPSQALKGISYAELFTALGKFIVSKQLKDVCVMEFEEGVIVTGTVIYEVTSGYRRRQDTFVFAGDELRLLLDTGNSRRVPMGR